MVIVNSILVTLASRPPPFINAHTYTHTNHHHSRLAFSHCPSRCERLYEMDSSENRTKSSPGALHTLSLINKRNQSVHPPLTCQSSKFPPPCRCPSPPSSAMPLRSTYKTNATTATTKHVIQFGHLRTQTISLSPLCAQW